MFALDTESVPGDSQKAQSLATIQLYVFWEKLNVHWHLIVRRFDSSHKTGWDHSDYKLLKHILCKSLLIMDKHVDYGNICSELKIHIPWKNYYVLDDYVLHGDSIMNKVYETFKYDMRKKRDIKTNKKWWFYKGYEYTIFNICRIKYTILDTVVTWHLFRHLVCNAKSCKQWIMDASYIKFPRFYILNMNGSKRILEHYYAIMIDNLYYVKHKVGWVNLNSEMKIMFNPYNTTFIEGTNKYNNEFVIIIYKN